jgi:lysophospholipase L1-like esterase
MLIQAIQIRQPKAEVILLGLLPRRDYENRIEKLNSQIARLAEELPIKFTDIGTVFLNKEKKIKESLFSDGLHPNKKGYLKLRDALKPLLR